MIETKRYISKSQIKTFIQCPFKWKQIYIDNIPSIVSPQMDRGTLIHKKIERFYSNIPEQKYDKDLKNFYNFELNRLKECKDLKYFYPIFQELKISNDKLEIKGIIDAVYINPDDDKLIVIDWKTGKFNKSELDGYRIELAFYKKLLENSNKIKDVEVGYWGIYFTDQNKLFFEKADNKWIEKVDKIIEKIQKTIQEKTYPMKLDWRCRWCQFRDKCRGNNVNI